MSILQMAAAGIMSAAGQAPDPVVDISPISILDVNFGSELTPTAMTTNNVTASTVDGTTPITYAWTYVSGDSFTIDNPNSNITTFSTTQPAPLDGVVSTYVGTYRVTATDADSRTSTDDIVVTFTLEGSAL